MITRPTIYESRVRVVGYIHNQLFFFDIMIIIVLCIDVFWRSHHRQNGDPDHQRKIVVHSIAMSEINDGCMKKLRVLSQEKIRIRDRRL